LFKIVNDVLVPRPSTARSAVSGLLADLGLTEPAAGLLWALEPGTGRAPRRWPCGIS